MVCAGIGVGLLWRVAGAHDCCNTPHVPHYYAFTSITAARRHLATTGTTRTTGKRSIDEKTSFVHVNYTSQLNRLSRSRNGTMWALLPQLGVTMAHLMN